MRRELRILIVAFVLVVGPAVVLTWLAGRLITQWSLILETQLERSAARTLDEAAGALARGVLADCETLRRSVDRGWSGPGRRSALVNAVAVFRQSHAWCRGVYVVQTNGCFAYPAPPPASPADEASDAGAQPPLYRMGIAGDALAQQFVRTNDAAAVRGYADALAVPGIEPLKAAQLRLLSAGCLRRLGRLREAEHELRLVTGAVAAGAPLSDPAEGFHLDLLAQQRLVDLVDEAGEPARALDEALSLADGISARYDRIPPLQRAALLRFLDARIPGLLRSAPGDAVRRRCVQTMGLLSEWRRAGAPPEPRVATAVGGMAVPASGAAEWRWVNASLDDTYLVGRGPEGVAVVIDVDPLQLHAALAAVRASDIPSTMRLDLVSPFASRNASERGVIASLRLAQPLGAYTLVARPADEAAFESAARLQTRLYTWGATVLALAIISGGLLLWQISAAEIRHARSRSEFAAAVSHDLRTPLSSMRMLAESLYLGRVQDDAKRQRFLGTLVNECDRLGRLTERALYFIRFGQGALRYRLTEGDVGELVSEVAETYVAGGVHGDRHVRVQVAPGLPPVRFDAGAMEQVVLNLIDNAHKYSREPKDIRVTVEAAADPRWVVIAVQDHGIGIPPAELKRVFRPYYRGDRAKASEASGVGLGLALCRHIVKAHGGRIEVESVVDEGSTFRVRLPVA